MTADRRLTVRQVQQLLGVSKWTLLRLRERPDFPKPVYIAGNRHLMRWREEEILTWRAANEVAVPVSQPEVRG